jgi:hypothetical protein
MKRFLVYITIIIASWYPCQSIAAFTIDLNGFYSSDSLAYTSTTSNTRTFLSSSLNMAIDKGRSFYIGWSMITFSAPDTTTTSVTYTSSDMGPRIMYNFNKSGSFNIAVTYNLKATTTYTGSGASETLRGTSLLGEIGYTPEVAEGLLLGFKLNYYAPAFTESLVGTTTFTNVSYSRTLLFPSFSLSWQF